MTLVSGNRLRPIRFINADIRGGGGFLGRGRQTTDLVTAFDATCFDILRNEANVIICYYYLVTCRLFTDPEYMTLNV